jgi:ABC-2 type transport system ATP-binding protein
MIEAQNLTRRYGDYLAVDQISFSVSEGEIVGILGPNGAGKTTTIRMITGFLPPTSGRVTVAGQDIFDDQLAARRRLGYLPETVALYEEMRVREYLSYRARLFGLKGAEPQSRIDESLERCMLTDVQDQIIGTLSKGYRQRVGLAAAILHRPKVLVLDEPTIGLDPKQIVAIRELIRGLAKESTLLLSTHILPEVELLCDRVVIIDRGQIIAEGTPSDLRERWVGNPIVRVELAEDNARAGELFGAIGGVLEVRDDAQRPARLLVECESGHDVRADIFKTAVENSMTLVELTEEKASLEDVFVRLTTRDIATDANEAEAAETDEPADEVVS